MLKILKAIANDISGKARRFGKVLNVSGQINKVTLLTNAASTNIDDHRVCQCKLKKN
jgi:hypothetical protein